MSTPYIGFPYRHVETAVDGDGVEIDAREGIEERSGRIEEEATHVIFDVDVGAEFRETTSDVEGGRRPQHGVVHSRPAVLYIHTQPHTRRPLCRRYRQRKAPAFKLPRGRF